ncbi:MAG TPA: tetratricopeptide repeat protein [Burkholderiales bacterium]|nr:tetratricopeptide repeat protein [Burkholderiales bacterium]
MSILDSKHAMGMRGQSSYQPAGAKAQPEPGSDLELTRQENARSQLREGDLARSHLQGVYPGDLLATLASTASAGRSQKDWAQRALRAYTNAISLDPVLAEAYVGRATVYRFLGRYAEAKADLQRAERLGIADATQAVGHVENRQKVRRLAIAGACIVVAGICALWLFRASRPAPSPNPVEPPAPLALPAPVETHPAPPVPSVTVPPSQPVVPSAAPSRAPNASVPPEQQRAAAPEPSSPVPQREPQPVVKAGEAPQVGARTAATTPRAVATAAPALPAVAVTPTRPPEHVCAECDSVISALPAAAALGKEDIEMTKLACQSSEDGGSDAYQACVATQIAQLDEAIPMPDLTTLPAIDRQLVQRACTSATHNGPAAYRRCISSQLIGLAGAPDLPDLSALPAERRRAIELACRDSAAASAAAFHGCMVRQAKDVRRGAPSAASRP